MQTEVRLTLATEGTGHKKSGGKKSKGKGKGKKKSAASESSAVASSADPLLLFDDTYLDDHHKGMLMAYLLGDTSTLRMSYSRGGGAGGGGQDRSALSSIDLSQIALDLGTEACAPWLMPSCSTRGGPCTLLIGLGGGALAMAVQRYLPNMHLDIVELVPGLEEVARDHFGFVKGPKCRVLEGDGLDMVMSMQRANQAVHGGCHLFAYDHIIVDVDGKDASSSDGLSAPPREFVSTDFLTSLRSILTANGVLSLNVVCRKYDVIEGLGAALGSVFAAVGPSYVYKIAPSSEIVNITLHATAFVCPAVAAAALSTGGKHSGGKGKKGKGEGVGGAVSSQVAAKKMRSRELESWLQVRTIPVLLLAVLLHQGVHVLSAVLSCRV